MPLSVGRDAGHEMRRQALSQLIAVWPSSRPGLDVWIAEFESLLPANDAVLAQAARKQLAVRAALDKVVAKLTRKKPAAD